MQTVSLEQSRPAPLVSYPQLLIADLPDAERLAVQVTTDAVADVVAHWWTTPPGFHWLELAWDTRRLFGADAGFAIFNDLADTWDPPDRLEFLVELWADAGDRRATQFDRLWIDAMAGARADGWVADGDLGDLFERLEDKWAREELERRAEREEFDNWMSEVVAMERFATRRESSHAKRLQRA